MKSIGVIFILCGLALTVTCQSDSGEAPDLDVRGNWDWGTGGNEGARRPPSGRTTTLPPPPPRRTNTPRQTPPTQRPTAAANPGIDGNGQLIGCPCRSTQETNLVCGTDGNTYGNMGKLRCAIACGHRVELSHIGTCRGRDIIGLQ